MSYNTYSEAGGASPRDNTPCGDAFDRLSSEQSLQSELIGQLLARLDTAMRGEAPTRDDAAVKAVEPAPQSEIHGRFLGAADRCKASNRALMNILDRLTL